MARARHSSQAKLSRRERKLLSRLHRRPGCIARLSGKMLDALQRLHIAGLVKYSWKDGKFSVSREALALAA